MASIVAILLTGKTGFVTILLGFIYFVLAILVGVPLLTTVITLYLFTILLFKGVFIYFISTHALMSKLTEFWGSRSTHNTLTVLLYIVEGCFPFNKIFFSTIV